MNKCLCINSSGAFQEGREYLYLAVTKRKNKVVGYRVWPAMDAQYRIFSKEEFSASFTEKVC
jgi:hypothetical protein